MNRSVPPPEPDPPAPSPRRKRWPRGAWWLVAAAAITALALVLVRAEGERARDAASSSAVDASAPTQPSGPKGEVTVEGYVRDDTDAPLERAQVLVTLLEWPELAPRTATTDGAGRFAIHDLPREPLLFSVSREGHESDERTFRPGDPLALTFVLSRQGELMVLLRDEPGRVLEGAEVVLTGPELWPPRSARANAAGEVLFKQLAGGSYSARARKQERIAPPSTLQLVVPGERGRLELSLRPGERLTGTIVDGDSKRPLSGVKLSVQDSTPGIAPLEGTSDAAGNFTLAGLWPVAIRLELSREGYARGFEELKLPHPAPLALALRGAVSLAGRVVDERGKPVANAAVSLSTHDELPLDLAPALPGLAATDSGVGELGVTKGDIPPIPVTSPSDGWGLGALATYTDASGRFRIDGLPPVPLLLSASRPGYAGATSELRELAPHGERLDLELVLHAAGKIAGRLVDARGEPVSNVLVRAQSSTAEHSSITDARGEFMLHDVLGETTVTANPAGYEAPHCRVTVDAGETARCDLRIGSPLFTLPVRVVDEFGLALEGAEVTATFQVNAPTGTKVQRSVTRLSADDGTASLSELPAPPYKLDVALNDYVGVHDLAVTSAERELRVVLRRAATLSGIVLDALGRPVPSALVTSEGAETAESGSDGSFTLLGVVPGALSLSAAHPRAGSGKSAELRARPSESLGGIRIVLSGRYDSLPDAGSAAATADEPEGEERASKTDSTFAQRGRAVIVADVQPGTAAARAGLKDGDVLQAIDGEPPLSAAHARGLLRDPAGKVANVRVLRQKKVVTLRYRRPPL